MKRVKIVTALAVASFTACAFAQTDTRSTRRIDKRQANQERRIQQGEKSGALTQKEATRLEKGQGRVQRVEDKAVADGRVTPRERARIEKAQDRQSKKIYREKHDKQTAK